MSIRDQYAEIDEDFVFFDDLDDAVIGYVSAVIGEDVILYPPCRKTPSFRTVIPEGRGGFMWKDL